MTAIRILVSELPRILREIVTSVLDSEDDMRIVGYTSDTAELDEALRRARADVLVVGCAEADLFRLGDELLAGRPFLKILALDGDGRRSFLYQLKPHVHALGEMSPELLIQTVRAATAPLSELKTRET